MTGNDVIVRASSLSGYPDCPRRGAARIFRRDIEAAGYQLRELGHGIGAAIGTAVHVSAQITLSEKARSGRLPPASVASDCAADSVEEAANLGVVYDGPRGTTHTRNEAINQATEMALAYHRVIAPTVEPILIEERLEAEVSPGLILSGQPDVVAREPHQIRDLKSGKQQRTHSPQVGAYSLLARSHGYDIQLAAIDFVRRVSKPPQPDPVSTIVPIEAAETAATNILRHIAGDLRVFRDGDPARRLVPGDPWAFLANPASMLCSERYCEAWGTEFCHEHAAEKQHV